MNWQPFWEWWVSMVPDPEPEPEPVPVPAPTPEPVAPQADEAELQHKAHQLSKEWNKLSRKIDRVTGRGYRWS
jgi:hypothetical protein